MPDTTRASWKDSRRIEREGTAGAAAVKLKRERKDGTETENQEREEDIQETEGDGRTCIWNNKERNGLSTIYATGNRKGQYGMDISPRSV